MSETDKENITYGDPCLNMGFYRRAARKETPEEQDGQEDKSNSTGDEA